MVMLAAQYEYVIGGDPDRDTIDLAVIATATGVVRGHHMDSAAGVEVAGFLFASLCIVASACVESAA